jgi:uncharacterized membrane protein YeaQ/YmgE (transglycosylase-associated protein family)
MIDFHMWIIVGALVGWVASIIVRAFVGGLFLSPLFNVSTINRAT